VKNPALCGCRLADKRWEAIWITAKDISEEGLLLSKHMLLDHLPDRTVVVINSAAGQLSQNVPGQFHNKTSPLETDGLHEDIVQVQMV
jgi:hypothetical protein